MKAEEFRKMSDEDLAKKEGELREELGNLVFQHKLRPLEDTSRNSPSFLARSSSLIFLNSSAFIACSSWK